MTEKTKIVDFLGENALVLPAFLNAAIAANERAKYLMTLLQVAADQAQHPQAPAPTLRAEREACGIAATELDRAVARAELVVVARESAADAGLAGKTVGHFVDEALKGNLVGSVGGIAKEVLKAGDEAIRKDGLRQEEQPPSSGTDVTQSPSGDRPLPGSSAQS